MVPIDRSIFLRLEGELSWAELNPAFGYTGLKLKTRKLDEGHDLEGEPIIEAVDQFAQEIDHMSLCVQRGLNPHTPGEEGLQDIRIIEAIYESAKTGKTIKLSPLAGPTRGPAPTDS
jgi:predicted dehydrogenase